MYQSGGNMILFSHLLIFSCILYLSLGIYVLYLDRKAVLNAVFSLLNLSLALWAFTLVMLINSPDKQGCAIWSEIGSIGYCAFASLSVHFFLVFTKKEALLKKKWIYAVLYLPSAVFIYQAFKGNLYIGDFNHGPFGWTVVARTGSAWFWIFIVFIMLSGMINISLCYLMLKKSTVARERNQSRIILISAIISFLLCFGFIFLSKNFKTNMPDITVIGLVVWIFGILYAIIKYRLMILTPSIAAENILDTIVDSVILADLEGLMINVNPETTRLLGYDSTELIGKPLQMLFPRNMKSEISNIVEFLETGPIRNKETFFVSRNNTRIPIIFSASACNDRDGHPIGFVAVSRDITRLKDAEGRLKHLAHHDILTDLPNRLLLNERLTHAIARAERYNNYVGVMLIDLDRFKEINDVYGHSIGDLLLIEVANRLTASVRGIDTIARFGGDEFIVVLDSLEKETDYERIVKLLTKFISEPYVIESHEINITASIGISVYPVNGTNSEVLIKCSDLAMYYAKDLGKNNYQRYNPSMFATITKRMAMENQLRKAIINNELLLYYQPILDIYKKTIIGVEALVRWNHPEFGMILPGEFIPIAEETGFILDIGEWVLRTACFQVKTWQREGFQPTYLSVNISAHQFQPRKLADTIQEVLNETALAPEYLILEITESTAMHDLENTVKILTELQNLGVKVAIDDFGTGYSSLIYLRNLSIYAIKIDKCFIQNITKDTQYAAIVSAIIAMAHSMDIKVIAEGVENQPQLESLLNLKLEYTGSSICDEVQGFLFSRPMPHNKITDMLERQK